MEIIKLTDFRPVSMLRTPEHLLTKPKFPVIDAHSHLARTRDVQGLLRAMDEFGIRAIVDLDGMPNERGEEQLKNFVEPHPDRFTIFVQVDASGSTSLTSRRMCKSASPVSSRVARRASSFTSRWGSRRATARA